MKIYTINSVYEVDLELERVRRIEGEDPSLLGVPDGTWLDYVEYRTQETPLGVVYVFFLRTTFADEEISWFRTSLVKSIEHELNEVEK